jgi:hypothetical protein
MDLTLYIGAGSVATIIVLIEATKNVVSNSKWYVPLSIIYGIILNVAITAVTATPVTSMAIVQAVIVGIMAGGTASGLWSGNDTIKNAASPAPPASPAPTVTATTGQVPPASPDNTTK